MTPLNLENEVLGVSQHPVPLGVMWKTVSEDCNLACDYCYYSRTGGKLGTGIRRIDDEVLKKFIREYMHLSRGAVSFAWQGGEPLLAGLDFFKRVVEFQAQYAPPNTSIGNSVQTNGTLINADFARLFRTFNFLVGVSLDGPKPIHDSRRVNRGGGGSFDAVMRGIQHLRNFDVDFNILTVVHDGNVDLVEELFTFYAQERFEYIQFIPCMDFRAQETGRSAHYLITPEQYGEFLCNAFNLWYHDGQPVLSVRFFDNLLSVYMHREAEMCTHRSTCSHMLILEQNGDAYPCDFYISDEYRLGNVGADPLADILASPVYRKFLAKKSDLPHKCFACKYVHLCHGGCPRNRHSISSEGSQDIEFFCESYYRLYEHAHVRLETLAKRMLRHNLLNHVQRGGKLPGRNDPCLCGSGKKYKKCCEPLSHGSG